MENYRNKFKKYYGIDFSKNYDIHHIDLNHNNNDISNLMILPKKLHNQYHLLLNNTYSSDSIFCKQFDARIRSNLICGNLYNMQMAGKLIEVLYECNKWYDFKLYLEGEIPNIHNLKVEV